MTPKNIRDKLWKHNLGEKLRFSFSKSRLDDNIAKLRSHNDDLRTLAVQTRPRTSTATRLRSNPPRVSRYDIQKYQVIGKASCQVYEALRKACTKHSEHMAHFRTEVEHAVLDEKSSLQIKFEMAYTHRVRIDVPYLEDPIWFLVDSIISEHIDTCTSKETACMDELKKSLKRQLTPIITPVAKKVKKSVRFASTMPAPLPASLPAPCLPLPSTTSTCIGTDLCDHLRRHFRGSLCSNACVVLENTAQCKQLVYPSHFTACSQPRQAISLGQLIASTTEISPINGILLHERVSLAKMLATAVLQYHATPWLQLSWRSDDILFFSIKEDIRMQKRPDLSAPYINTKIHGNAIQVRDQPRSVMARNPILFSLGVVLLEIAHGASLESLKLPCDADNGQLHCEFFTARRLAKTKRTNMGTVYDDIVEQLVECVFPHGGDLNNPELQATFYDDVICPLDELEQGMRKLGIGGSDC